MQTVMQLKSLILYYNKDLFSHNDMGEATSLSLVGVLLRSMAKPSPTGTIGVFEAAFLFDCKWVIKYVKGS